jgi:ABC-type uncharacterized transport system permease subunit
MLLIFFLFCIIALIATFYAYRVLKGYQYDQMGIQFNQAPYGGAMNLGRNNGN